MCGRFVRFTSWAELRRTMTLLSPSADAPELSASYNVAPTQKVLVARDQDGKRERVVMRWGLIPSWANGWYEWKASGKQKHPFFFRMKADEPMLFAGLWETWDDEEGPVETCAILTTDANDLTKEVHNRMPVILAGNDALSWIEPGDDKEKLNELLVPFSPEKLAYHAVDTMVGNVRNNSPECIKPDRSLF